MHHTLSVSPQDKNTRLDVFLVAHFPNVSRSRIQRHIKNGEVTVNGKAASAHFALRENDTITLSPLPEENATEELTPRHNIPLTIIYEDNDVIVAEKPSGLIVHPSTSNDSNTLANALLSQYPEIKNVGESWERPGIVHRLDKDASGILVVARNQNAYKELKSQFQAHTITKEYTVLVHGGPIDDSGTISFPIARLKGSGRMAAKPVGNEEAREAVTHFSVEHRYTNATLLTIRTETGRTHQIRVHMKALDMPIVGDILYKKKNLKPLPVPRLFLHAKTLEFSHPTTGIRMRFESPLPKPLQVALKKLTD